MTEREETCTWDGERGWTKPDQMPCGKTHCAMRGKCAHHLGIDELTCPRCIGKVRRDLAGIEDRYADLPEQTEHRGIGHASLSLHGPAAQRVPRAEYDQQHPLLVLGRWDMMLREDYEQPTGLSLTVSRARDYLDRTLTRMANDPEQDFELFAREVGACLAYLEQVLDDSRQPDKGAPCPTCSDDEEVDHAPRLTKVWGVERAADDRWQCPRQSEHWWTDEGYREQVAVRYFEHAEWLTAEQMTQRCVGLEKSTLRRWANGWRNGSDVWFEPTVRKGGKDERGRQLYNVEDVEAARAAAFAGAARQLAVS